MNRAFDRPSTASSKEDIFKLIREDLQFASENFTISNQILDAGIKVRHHLRAKVEMWDENYSLAAEIVDEIINEGPYSLVSI